MDLSAETLKCTRRKKQTTNNKVSITAQWESERATSSSLKRNKSSSCQFIRLIHQNPEWNIYGMSEMFMMICLANKCPRQYLSLSHLCWGSCFSMQREQQHVSSQVSFSWRTNNDLHTNNRGVVCTLFATICTASRLYMAVRSNIQMQFSAYIHEYITKHSCDYTFFVLGCLYLSFAQNLLFIFTITQQTRLSP